MAKLELDETLAVTALHDNTDAKLFSLTTGKTKVGQPTLTLEVFNHINGTSTKSILWRETLLDALVLLFPDNVAYSFETEEEDDDPPPF